MTHKVYSNCCMAPDRQKHTRQMLTISMVTAIGFMLLMTSSNDAFGLHFGDVRTGHPSIPVHDKDGNHYDIPLYFDTRQIEFYIDSNKVVDLLPDKAYVIGITDRSVIIPLGGSTYDMFQEGNWTKYVLNLTKSHVESIVNIHKVTNSVKFGLKDTAVSTDDYIFNHKVEHSLEIFSTATPPPQQDPPQQDPPQDPPQQDPPQDPQQQDPPTESTIDPALVASVKELASQTQHGAEHVDRWTRVLAAFGETTHDNPMTAAEARTNAEKYSSPLWPQIADILTLLEAAAEQDQPQQLDPPPQDPPQDPPQQDPPTESTIDPALVASVKELASQTQHGAEHVDRWTRVLAAFGETTHDNPMTAAEARTNSEKYSSPLWPQIADVLAARE